ncbi:MAG: hypothetical protein A3B17_02160 [Candidatus Yanofskybacteria bacterium RIFCSPLOWO2_01_FULL_45_72]|nr:MAG: hypothetical protein A3B17_02160 [Candidatus Yanofskybacteria bacterium RIFCSPLOWO2_01_FULL_45_72]
MSKSILVIGGTTGLGHEIALQAETRGYVVTVSGRTALTYNFVPGNDRLKFFNLDFSKDEIVLPSDLGLFDVVFWSAGIQQKGRFVDLNYEDIRRTCRIYLENPVKIIVRLCQNQILSKRPLHLVVIGSSTSWHIRKNESLYGALKAGQSQLARTLGCELPVDIPGSKILLVQPGAMNTPFWKNDTVNMTKFMKPEAVARLIWEEVDNQKVPFREIQIIRQSDGSTKREEGARIPHI